MNPQTWMETSFNSSHYDVTGPNSGVGDESRGGGSGGIEGPRSPRYEKHRASSVYDTKYLKSLRHYLTREVLPRASHYKDLDELVASEGRPTLDDLHDNTYKGGESKIESAEIVEGTKGVVKLGWIHGVYIACLLNTWCVNVFLRIPWIVAEAGIIYGVIIVCLANVVTLITTLSMSAVATNGEIKGGGIYYMISRSLGPEFGAAIGLMFTVANAVGTAVHAIGFVEAVQLMVKDYCGVTELFPGTGGGANDVRILSVITTLVMLIPTVLGMEWVIRINVILLIVLVAAQVDFVIGALIGPINAQSAAKGFIGPNGYLFVDNLKADFRYNLQEQSFFSVFSVFFPAVCGITAGANVSGDLKDPSSAIPKGTLLSIATTFASYILYTFIVGVTCIRQAYGNDTVYLEYENVSLSSNPFENPTFGEEYCPFDENGQSTCKYGSQNDFKIMEITAGWGPLIYIGCFAASLSSVIACLVGSPRILQALARDKLYPYLHVFAKGYGVNDNPLRGCVVVVIMTFCCLMLGDLNAVSALLTNFFLASYGLVNFSCFHASFVNSPGWRPAFKYYNLWVSLIGGILCIAVMFLIDWVTALCTMVVCVILFVYVAYRHPDVNWGSSTQAQTYVSALKASLELVYVEDHVKNFRPQILLLSGNPAGRPSLVDFANYLTKDVSLLTCANIVKGPASTKLLSNMNQQSYKWMTKHNIKGFCTEVEASNIEEGSKYLFQLSGLGKLRPNIVLLGYKANWQKCERSELKAYFNTLHYALDMHYGVVILRVPEGFDYSHVLNQNEFRLSVEANELTSSALSIIHENGDHLSDFMDPAQDELMKYLPNSYPKQKKKKNDPSNLYEGVGDSELSRDVLNSITRFRVKQRKGTIDVWWLYDDGGLTLLLPHILSTRSHWAGCTLRVFALANHKDELEMEQISMANLLNKFRIDFSDVIIIQEITKKAASAAKDNFDKLIKGFKSESDVISKEDEGIMIVESELLSQHEKTNRHIRLRDCLLANSRGASLIVMTLPMPRKKAVSAPLYMAWLETLTKGMPPFMLVRGNQTSVLTYYS